MKVVFEVETIDRETSYFTVADRFEVLVKKGPHMVEAAVKKARSLIAKKGASTRRECPCNIRRIAEIDE